MPSGRRRDRRCPIEEVVLHSPTPPHDDRPRAARRRPALRAGVLLSAVALLSVGTVTVGLSSSQAATSVAVTVDTSRSKGTVPATGNGVNMAVWDGNMNTAASRSLLSSARVKALRFPGGSYGDDYHWKTHTTDDGSGYIASGTTYDEFAATAGTI